ncbi:MAG: hypothetical protein IPJ23_01680 [Ignavibacteriales bacterium]|nr:hypothetical protein [Ignavibacteriales bacterium]
MLYKIIALIFFGGLSVFSQSKDTLYSLSVDIGGGYLRYITSLEFESLDQNGFSGSVRIIWHPEHLLSLGLETGYMYLYSINPKVNTVEFGASEAKASMVSVPIFAIFSMIIFPESLPNLEVKFGPGVFLLYNRGEVFNEKIKNSLISIGMTTGVTYMHPLSEDISIGGELKYQNISKMQDSDFAIQIMFSYKFLHW